MSRPIVHVVGARPNFMKAAPVVKALDARNVHQTVVHTGQHYDEAMSAVFFEQLQLPEPDLDLGVGSGTHAQQTAALLTGLEGAFEDLDPGYVVVYGDVNSTIAAALVASKLLIPLAHVEAGLRSFDLTMPEEVNRKLTDSLSDLLFVTSPEAIGHLAREGVDQERIHFVGNPMIDTLVANLDRFDPDAFRSTFDIDGDYALATLHRPANVDFPDTAARLVAALREVCETIRVLLPLHPRGRPTLEAAGLSGIENLTVLEPLGYVEFLSAVRAAKLVITDSGGVQEETTVLGVPCLTVRSSTERPITISHGTNELVTVEQLASAARKVLEAPIPSLMSDEGPPLWDGNAGDRIGTVLARVTVEI